MTVAGDEWGDGFKAAPQDDDWRQEFKTALRPQVEGVWQAGYDKAMEVTVATINAVLSQPTIIEAQRVVLVGVRDGLRETWDQLKAEGLPR